MHVRNKKADMYGMHVRECDSGCQVETWQIFASSISEVLIPGTRDAVPLLNQIFLLIITGTNLA